MRSEENPIVEEQLKLAEVDLQAAWRGEELSKRPDWLRRMEDSEVAECLAAARRLADDADDRCGGAELESIMPTFTRRLQSIQFDLENRSGATLLRGFPLDEIEPATVPRLFVAAMSLMAGIVRRLEPATEQGASDEEVKGLLHRHRIEKVLVVNDNRLGLIVSRDLRASGLGRDLAGRGLEGLEFDLQTIGRELTKLALETLDALAGQLAGIGLGLRLLKGELGEDVVGDLGLFPSAIGLVESL